MQHPEHLDDEGEVAAVCEIYAALVGGMLEDGDSELLLAVAKQQPPATCQALELAVRGARPTHHHTTVPLAHLSCEVAAVQLDADADAAAAMQPADERMLDSAAPTSSGSGSSSSSGSSSPNLVNSMPAAFVALLPALGARLVACGEGLAALCPVPLCCNNPRCEELRGLSEQKLVAGKGCVCSRCRSARYCSKACQVAHHPAHKKICKSIAASTAT
ncbi:hypothetical protein OEZ85_013209 [Tetradesmus obliquus]|uniref:MYND-type domain-containing protein n=1 Tax=Tetradesmus obliquus TaxID=3088 RepID=A0ABY8UA52_TETOB|nr:hypothetical protein OEZ85_013209 [Tetradesmus obliquus]